MHAHLCCIFTSRPPTHCLLWHRYCALGLEYTSKGPWKRACSPTWCYRKAVGLVVGLGHCGGALEEDCRTFRSFLSPFHLRLRWTDLLGVCFCHGCYERSLFQELKAPKEWSHRGLASFQTDYLGRNECAHQRSPVPKGTSTQSPALWRGLSKSWQWCSPPPCPTLFTSAHFPLLLPVLFSRTRNWI